MSSPVVYSKKRKHPSGAMYVGRPGFFGNPFTVEKYNHGHAIALYREWIMLPEQEHVRTLAKEVLRGRDLLCWCAPNPCHAEILLEIASGVVMKGADYVVVRGGEVVQEITALGAANALKEKKEEGVLYARVGAEYTEEIDELLAEIARDTQQ